jgi:rare lipoprotein A
MRPSRNPLALLRPRWRAAIAALAILAVGAGSAQAATGGAGVATAPAGEDIAFSPFRSAGASWYGPGLWGNKTACGQTLRPSTLGVAHRNLPCGTAVKFVYRGRALVTQVIDRGPYAKGRAWDLTAAASEALEFKGVGMVRYAIAVDYARPGARR